MGSSCNARPAAAVAALREVKPRRRDGALRKRQLVKKRALMSLIPFLVFGLVVGVMARWIVPRAIWGGWVNSITLGVFGAFLGGLLGHAFGWCDEGQPAGFVMATLGALLTVAAYHVLARRRPLRARH